MPKHTGKSLAARRGEDIDDVTEAGAVVWTRTDDAERLDLSPWELG